MSGWSLLLHHPLGHEAALQQHNVCADKRSASVFQEVVSEGRQFGAPAGAARSSCTSPARFKAPPCTSCRLPARRARNAGGLPRTADGKVDYSKDFFSKPSYLTVSGQLNGASFLSAEPAKKPAAGVASRPAWLPLARAAAWQASAGQPSISTVA